MIISGSSNGSDGVFAGDPWYASARSFPTHSSMGLHDFMFFPNGWHFWFIGGLNAILPAGFSELGTSVNPDATDGGLAFEFNNDHVTRWTQGSHNINVMGPSATYGYRAANMRGYATAVGVPEPSTLLLVGLGVVLALRRRRSTGPIRTQ